jgi:hypothetical protein
VDKESDTRRDEHAASMAVGSMAGSMIGGESLAIAASADEFDPCCIDRASLA